MDRLRAIFRDEGGVAIVLAMIVLLALSTLVVAFLAVSAFEPQISANLTSGTQARYVGEAGIEAAFDYFGSNPDWSAALAASGATCAQGGIVPTTTANNALPGLTANSGTFTVRVRNDCLNGDELITGVPLDTAGGGNATTDVNNRVILTSTGALGTATKNVKVVLRRSLNILGTIGGALSFPGINSNVNFSGSSFTIRGIDTQMGSETLNGTAPPVLGIAVGADINGNTTVNNANETEIDTALANNQQNSVEGKSQLDPNTTSTGENTTAYNGSLTKEMVTDFVNAIKNSADVAIDAPQGNTFQTSNIGDTCATNINSTTCWGTLANPKIVYVKGNSNGTQQYNALDLSGHSQGTGILIVENGNFEVGGTFTWNGLVIVTGTGVQLRYRGGGDKAVWGAVIVNELSNDGPTNLEAEISGNSKIFYSSQALGLVNNAVLSNPRKLMSLYSWQEQ
jgi:hypothetical protein